MSKFLSHSIILLGLEIYPDWNIRNRNVLGSIILQLLINQERLGLASIMHLSLMVEPSFLVLGELRLRNSLSECRVNMGYLTH